MKMAPEGRSKEHLPQHPIHSGIHWHLQLSVTPPRTLPSGQITPPTSFSGHVSTLDEPSPKTTPLLKMPYRTISCFRKSPSSSSNNNSYFFNSSLLLTSKYRMTADKAETACVLSTSAENTHKNMKRGLHLLLNVDNEANHNETQLEKYCIMK